MSAKALIQRTKAIALNIIRVTLENGKQYTIQELNGELNIVEYKE